jgi:hypothetical protein
MVRARKASNEEGQWQCTLCNKWKDPEEFYKSQTSSSGLTARCKLCMKITQITWKLANGRDTNWPIFPFATDDELDQFTKVLLEWHRFPAATPSGRIAVENLRKWLEYFEGQTYAGPRPVASGPPIQATGPIWRSLTETKPGSTVRVGQYETQMLGPPPDKDAWMTKRPGEMTEAEYAEWADSGLPSDPAERRADV